MRTRILAVLFVAALTSFAPACRNGDCELRATCAPGGGDLQSGSDAGGDGGLPTAEYPLVDPPPGCVPDADPKESLACADNRYALFVDPIRGNDTNPGTRELPLHSIAGATNVDRLRGRPRIYVCAGTAPFDESVELPPNVSLVGGFVCETWSYVGVPVPVIAPSTNGLAALHVMPATKLAVSLSDIEVRGAKGNEERPSSVGIFLSRTKTTLRRVHVTGGDTVRPLDWTNLPTNAAPGPPAALDGYSADTTVAAAKTCTCALTGSSTGGAGGDIASPGGQGEASPGGTPTVGGDGNASACGLGQNGPDGESGAGGTPPNGAPGRLDADRGWLGADGANGLPGNPGVGGSGGGGRASTRGGGGACGGCGGNGGRGGRAGGSSIALAIYDSEVATFESSFVAKAGSNGANGEHGENGFSGGKGGKASSGSICTGGAGGAGAGGGGGSGGTSGISAAVVRFKGSYSPDGLTKRAVDTNGAAGNAAAGGDGGKNGSSSAPSGGVGQAGTILFERKELWELME